MTGIIEGNGGGVTPSGPGCQPPASAASSTASSQSGIPNALPDQTLYAWTSVGDYRNYPQFVNVSLKDGRVRVIVRSLETIDPDKGWPVTGAWAEAIIPDDEVRQFAEAFSRAASAIEARRAETQGGSVADESAVAKPDAQGTTPCP